MGSRGSGFFGWLRFAFGLVHGDLGEGDRPVVGVAGFDTGGMNEVAEGIQAGGQLAVEIGHDPVVERRGGGGGEEDLQAVEVVLVDLFEKSLLQGRLENGRHFADRDLLVFIVDAKGDA